MIQLQEELAQLYGDDFIPHESGDECISCERPASEEAFPYCTLCLMRHRRDYAASELTQLQDGYAVILARAIKAEEEIERLNRRLATANHKVVAWSRRVMPG